MHFDSYIDDGGLRPIFQGLRALDRSAVLGSEFQGASVGGMAPRTSPKKPMAGAAADANELCREACDACLASVKGLRAKGAWMPASFKTEGRGGIQPFPARWSCKSADDGSGQHFIGTLADAACYSCLLQLPSLFVSCSYLYSC